MSGCATPAARPNVVSVQLTVAPLHTPEQVQEIINQALEIEIPAALDAPTRVAAFEQACILLGARASAFITEQPMPLSNGIPTLGGWKP
jgi:hypothetical protein